MEIKEGDKVRVRPGIDWRNPPHDSRGRTGAYSPLMTNYQGKIFQVRSAEGRMIFLVENEGYYWLDTWLEKLPNRKVNLRPKL